MSHDSADPLRDRLKGLLKRPPGEAPLGDYAPGVAERVAAAVDAYWGVATGPERVALARVLDEFERRAAREDARVLRRALTVFLGEWGLAHAPELWNGRRP